MRRLQWLCSAALVLTLHIYASQASNAPGPQVPRRRMQGVPPELPSPAATTAAASIAAAVEGGIDSLLHHTLNDNMRSLLATEAASEAAADEDSDSEDTTDEDKDEDKGKDKDKEKKGIPPTATPPACCDILKAQGFNSTLPLVVIDTLGVALPVSKQRVPGRMCTCGSPGECASLHGGRKASHTE